MNLDKFYQVLNDTSYEEKERIKFSMDVLDRLHELLDQKFEGKQKLLALKMNKSEAQISKFLSGIQNYTTKTLFEFQKAFGEPIISVPPLEIKFEVRVALQATYMLKMQLLEKNREVQNEWRSVYTPKCKIKDETKLSSVLSPAA